MGRSLRVGLGTIHLDNAHIFPPAVRQPASAELAMRMSLLTMGLRRLQVKNSTVNMQNMNPAFLRRRVRHCA